MSKLKKASTHRLYDCVALLGSAFYAIGMVVSAWLVAPVADEPAHLLAGVYLWRTGSYDLYNVNPPLVKQVASLPTLVLGYPATAPLLAATAPETRSEFNRGRQFLALNPRHASSLISYGRWACLPLVFVGMWVAIRWARELYGGWAGMAAGAMWCASPTILGHSPLITADGAATSIGLLACYAFWRFLQAPSWRNALLTGLALGICLLTKTLWILLFAAWPATLVVWQIACARQPEEPAHASPNQKVNYTDSNWLKLAAIFFIGLATLNVGYGFSGFARPLGSFQFHSAALSGQPVSEVRTGNRFHGTWAARVPVPLPASFVRGIDLQRRDFEVYPSSYLRGQWSTAGWWYYYLYALGVKETLGFLVLLGTALCLTALVPAFRVRGLDELVLLAPCVAVFALASSQMRMNHHFRYVMPSLPFLFIFASKLFSADVPYRAFWRGLGVTLVLCAAISTYAQFPYTIAYFNELAGGPANGWRHLHDSNTDWSQGMFALRRWQEQHPERKPLYLAPWRHGLAPRLFGIEYLEMHPDIRGANVAAFRGLPDGPVPGWHVISSNEIIHDDYRYLREMEPRESIVGCYLVYYLTADDANRFRREAGRPLFTP